MNLPWVETPVLTVPPVVRADLLGAAVNRTPTSELRMRYAQALFEARRYGAAAAAFAAMDSDAWSADAPWAAWAQACLAADAPEAVPGIVAAARAACCGVSPRGVSWMSGMAHMRIGRPQAARCEFLDEILNHSSSFAAVEALMKSLITESASGAELIGWCERIPAAYQNSPVMRAYHALALSLDGQADAAAEAMSLARVCRMQVSPPDDFGDIASFNAALVDEISRNPDMFVARNEAFRRTDSLGYPSEPALRAFIQMCHGLMEAYVAQTRADGFAIDPQLARPVGLHFQANLLSGEEAHPAHLHKQALVAGVYHVAVPNDGGREGGEGDLLLGSLAGLLDAHVPLWRQEAVRPEPGWAIMFPAHIFHAVRATRSDTLRAAIAFDLVPA